MSIYKGTALDTTKVAIKDGQLLFETDTKKIWLDSSTIHLTNKEVPLYGS